MQDELISRNEVIRLAMQGEVQGFEWFFDKLFCIPSVTPQTDVLNKIRAEIERERTFQRTMDEYEIATGLRKALEIIDEYKAESEESDTDGNKSM